MAVAGVVLAVAFPLTESAIDEVRTGMAARFLAGRIVGARIDARYVEAGEDRRATRNYTLRYRWEGGGLFGGRSLRIAGLSR